MRQRVLVIIVGVIKALNHNLIWAIDKQFQFISHVMLLKNSYTTKELSNKAILSLKNNAFIALW